MYLRGKHMTMSKVMIHRIIHEPYPTEDDAYCMVALVEDGGEIFEDAICSQDLDSLYEIVRHTKSKIEPFVIDMGEDEEGYQGGTAYGEN